MNLSAHRYPEPSVTAGAVGIVEKALAIDGRPVRLAVYEGLRTFFEDNTKLNDGWQGSPPNPATLTGIQTFSTKAIELAVIGPISAGSAETEDLRLKRAAALLAYTSAPAALRNINLAPFLQQWTSNERSLQVRQQLELASQRLGHSSQTD